MIETDPPFIKDVLVTMAALISCGVGISAFRWAKDEFHPLVANIAGHTVLALVRSQAVPQPALNNMMIIQLSRDWVNMQYFLTHYNFPSLQFCCVQRMSKNMMLNGRSAVAAAKGCAWNGRWIDARLCGCAYLDGRPTHPRKAGCLLCRRH